MKTNWEKLKKRAACSILIFVIAASVIPPQSVSAKESIGNGIILSTDSITLTDGASATFTAVLGDGADASRLACVVADPNVAAITPVAYAANAAAYQITYGNGGSTVAAGSRGLCGHQCDAACHGIPFQTGNQPRQLLYYGEL